MSDVFVSAFAAAVSKPGKSVVRSLNSSYEAAAAFHVTDNCFSGLSPLQKDICTDRSILVVCLSKVGSIVPQIFTRTIENFVKHIDE